MRNPIIHRDGPVGTSSLSAGRSVVAGLGSQVARRSRRRLDAVRFDLVRDDEVEPPEDPGRRTVMTQRLGRSRNASALCVLVLAAVAGCGEDRADDASATPSSRAIGRASTAAAPSRSSTQRGPSAFPTLVSCGDAPTSTPSGGLVAQISSVVAAGGRLDVSISIAITDQSTPVEFSSGPAELVIARRGMVVGKPAITGAVVATSYRATGDRPITLQASIVTKGCPVGGDDTKRAALPHGADYQVVATVSTNLGQLITRPVRVNIS